MRPAEGEVLVPIPFTAVDAIVDWIDGNVPTRTHRAVPQYLTTVTMPAEGPDGVDVFESIERIEPNGLFAIRTLPRRRSPAPAKTVLFFVMSNDLHVGPAREWVELSRRIAAAGSQAVRWDPAGQGLSGEICRDPWRRVYSKADITDSAAARQACQDAGELQLVGICSGVVRRSGRPQYRCPVGDPCQPAGMELARHPHLAVAVGRPEENAKHQRG